MNTEIQENHSGLSDIGEDKEGIVKYYDQWAESYEATLNEWEYEAPRRAASLLRVKLKGESRIIDAGCGTGMTGMALREAGFVSIEGMDFSPQSLEQAEKHNCYDRLINVDMKDLPLPQISDSYDGLLCVGVLTYLPDSEAILREFCRIVKPGGHIVVTQRSDTLVERQFDKVLGKLAREGLIGKVNISEPRPYLPNHEEFGEEILVHYIDFSVA